MDKDYLKGLSDEFLSDCYREIITNTWGYLLERAYNKSHYAEIEMPKPYFISLISLEMARRWFAHYERIKFQPQKPIPQLEEDK